MRRRIRVMQAVPDLGVGGLSRVVESVCTTIDRDRFEVSVLSFHGGGEFVEILERAGTRVFTIGDRNFRTRTSYTSFIDVARLLRRELIDVLHTHNTQPLLDAVPGGVLAGVRTMIHTDHARPFPDRRRYMVAEWLLSRFVYRMVGVSEDTSRNLMHYEKIPPRKIVTIPNGIDGRVYAIPVDRDRLRRELAVPDGRQIVGFASRLEPQKGVQYLLEAMPLVVRECPPALLLIVGQGRQRLMLERRAVDLGLEHCVRFLGVRFDIPQLLGLFDVLVLPSLWEGLPMIVLEAMAAGCPIVASRVGGVPTAVEDGVSGLLVESRDAAALAQALISVLKDGDRRRRFAAEGTRRFQAGFTAEAMTRRYEELYARQPAS